MNRLQIGYYLLRYFGPRIALLRAGTYFRNWTGVSRRRFAARPWESMHLHTLVRPDVPTSPDEYACWKQDHPATFPVAWGRPPSVTQPESAGSALRKPDVVERLSMLRAGRCYYFSDYVSAKPIDWYEEPFTGCRSDPEKIWCDIPDYLPEQGDPRMLWEPARAGWAFDCAKAAARGHQQDARDIFWQWLDSWIEHCPPFQGFHWKCGQESAVRFIAATFGFYATGGSGDKQLDAQRWLRFARLAWATAFRIQHHIHYAISQKNNHAISEAVGLMLVSQLFPEFQQATEWAETGRRVLIGELRRQIYADGTYVQHSMNYQRVMMHGAVLGAVLCERSGQPLPQDLYASLERSSDFLRHMLDEDTGQVPQYGNNDGAHVLPLNECRFWDFRSVVQTTHFLARRTRVLPPGPWDEDLAWLFGATEDSPIKPDSTANVSAASPASGTRVPSKAFPDGGYYTLRSKHSWCMLRCHHYRDRPGHYDQLHVDLWWRGMNLLRDCGTHRYYVPGREDVERYFKSIRAHNTIELNDRDPLESVSRFLWLPWPVGEVVAYAPDAPIPHIVASHDDYARHSGGTRHRRWVLALAHDTWLIVDDLQTNHTSRIRACVRWQLGDLSWNDYESEQFGADTSVGAVRMRVVVPACERIARRIVRGADGADDFGGFAAPTYGKKVPIAVSETRFEGAGNQRVLTLLAADSDLAAIDGQPSSQSDHREDWTVSTARGNWNVQLPGVAASYVSPVLS